MKILITTDIFPPDVGGPATHVPALAAELVRHGHDVTVLTLSQVAYVPEDVRYPFVLDRVTLETGRSRRLGRFWGRLLVQLPRAHVVYVNGQLLPTFALNRIVRRPAIAKIVGDLVWEYARLQKVTSDDIETFQRRRYRGAVEWRRQLRSTALRHMEAVVVPSAYLARLVTEWGVRPERVHVVANAWIPPEAGPSMVERPRNGPRLITVCRLVAWKGVDELIEAVKELPDAELVVVGDGPERDALQRRAVQVGCPDRVVFTGAVSRSEVHAQLRASDVFVLNSRYEGFPHSVLEAYAAGTPVIATEVGGTPEAVRHKVTGLLIPPGDRAALRGAIREVLNDVSLRRHVVEGGRDMLARHSLASLLRATEALLERIASVSRSAVARSRAG